MCTWDLVLFFNTRWRVSLAHTSVDGVTFLGSQVKPGEWTVLLRYSILDGSKQCFIWSWTKLSKMVFTAFYPESFNDNKDSMADIWEWTSTQSQDIPAQRRTSRTGTRWCHRLAPGHSELPRSGCWLVLPAASGDTSNNSVNMTLNTYQGTDMLTYTMETITMAALYSLATNS